MENIYRITSLRIKELRDTLPAIILEKHFEIQPKLKEFYQERHKKLYLEDTGFHLSYLAESIAADAPILFNEYLSWAKTFFSTLPINLNDIVTNLELIRDTLAIKLDPELTTVTNLYMNAGIERFKSQSPTLPSYILDSNPLKTLANKYLSLLISGNKKVAHEVVMEAFQSGISIRDLYINLFQVTQKETGRLWQLSEINVGQEHFITSVTQLIMSQLYPFIFTSTAKEKKVIVSCIAGELHEMGPRMVADLFEMEGWDSYYFGANTPHYSLVNAVEVYQPHVLAISVTMTYNLTVVTELINTLKNNPKTNYVKILVGGYPFNLTDKLWKKIGADGSATNAIGAIELATNLIN